MHTLGKKTILLAVIAVLWCVPALAEEQEAGKWDFQLAPLYLWAVNIDGDVSLRGNNVPLTLDFGDIFDNLETVFTFHFESWYLKKFGLLLDYNFVDISSGQQTPELSLDVGFKSTMFEFGGLYRFIQGKHELECLLGGRYNKIENEIDIVGVPPRIDIDKDWTDLMVGLRYRWNITDRWQLVLRGDYATGGSNGTWNGVGVIQYQPWKYIGIIAGYRVMDIDYDDGSGPTAFEYDVRMHGPVLGLNILW